MAKELYKEITLSQPKSPKPPVKQKAYRGFSTVNPESDTFLLYDLGLIKQDLINHFNSDLFFSHPSATPHTHYL